MLYTRQQAAQYLGISDYAVGVLVDKGSLVPANLDKLAEAKTKGTRAFAKFTMDEMRRCKKARQEEEQVKEEERRKRAEEAARLKEEQRRTKAVEEGVPVSLSGVAMVSAVDLEDLKKRLTDIDAKLSQLDNVMLFISELRPFIARLEKLMI